MASCRALGVPAHGALAPCACACARQRAGLRRFLSPPTWRRCCWAAWRTAWTTGLRCAASESSGGADGRCCRAPRLAAPATRGCGLGRPLAWVQQGGAAGGAADCGAAAPGGCVGRPLPGRNAVCGGLGRAGAALTRGRPAPGSTLAGEGQGSARRTARLLRVLCCVPCVLQPPPPPPPPPAPRSRRTAARRCWSSGAGRATRLMCRRRWPPPLAAAATQRPAAAACCLSSRMQGHRCPALPHRCCTAPWGSACTTATSWQAAWWRWAQRCAAALACGRLGCLPAAASMPLRAPTPRPQVVPQRQFTLQEVDLLARATGFEVRALGAPPAVRAGWLSVRCRRWRAHPSFPPAGSATRCRRTCTGGRHARRLQRRHRPGPRRRVPLGGMPAAAVAAAAVCGSRCSMRRRRMVLHGPRCAAPRRAGGGES